MLREARTCRGSSSWQHSTETHTILRVLAWKPHVRVSVPEQIDRQRRLESAGRSLARGYQERPVFARSCHHARRQLGLSVERTTHKASLASQRRDEVKAEPRNGCIQACARPGRGAGDRRRFKACITLHRVGTRIVIEDRPKADHPACLHIGSGFSMCVRHATSRVKLGGAAGRVREAPIAARRKAA